MTMGTELGKNIDVFHQFVPSDIAAAAKTGARINMKNYQKVTFVGYFGAGHAAEPPTITLQEHTLYTGGTSTNLVVIDEFYTKSEASIDGDEAWVKVTQTAAATITDATWDDALEVLCCFTVDADALSDGYEFLSCNVADVGAGGTAKYSAMLAIGTELRVSRTPANLPQPNAA